MDINQLIEAVECDKRSHKIKDMALLLIKAMNDWDTPNQTSINEFITEFKSYFGNPVDINKIENKMLNMNHAWKHEAGSSIVLLLKMDNIQLDKAIEYILVYYRTHRKC